MSSSLPVALITGATSGIGAALAQQLAPTHRLALCGRRPDRLAALRTRLTDSKATILTESVDLRQESQILAFFERIQTEWGGVDVLINNAGLGHQANLRSGQTALWQDMLDVNVMALCICTREAIRQMEAKTTANPSHPAGQIIHISSLSGHRVPGPTSPFYAATKAAVRSLTEGLRQELRASGSSIRVTAISPGYVETEFAEKFYGDAAKATAVYSRFPCLQPQDIAAAVAYILAQPPHVQIHDILLRPTRQPT
ncbi:MAG: SDR family NAD(P)-dependent oxidoreductase [Prochlorothrix sp.]|nr:SDR family NAD(P)-dependent oxidoreductase [Prochlorothrix sp.]